MSEGGEHFRMRLDEEEEAPENGIDGLMEARGGDIAQLVMSLLRKHETLSWNLRSLIKSSSIRAVTWSVTLTQEERIGLYGVGSTPQQLSTQGRGPTPHLGRTTELILWHGQR